MVYATALQWASHRQRWDVGSFNRAYKIGAGVERFGYGPDRLGERPDSLLDDHLMDRRLTGGTDFDEAGCDVGSALDQ